MVDRIRVSVANGSPYPYYDENSYYDESSYYDGSSYYPHDDKFRIVSLEDEIDFQNSISISAGPPEIPEIIIEAEDLNLDTYLVETIETGDQVISLKNASDHTGTATLVVDDFSIDSGTYDLAMSVFDEYDGSSRLEVFVEDNLGGIEQIADIILDQGISSGSPDESSRREIVIEGVGIEDSSDIIIKGTANDWEFARVDFITLQEV